MTDRGMSGPAAPVIQYLPHKTWHCLVIDANHDIWCLTDAIGGAQFWHLLEIANPPARPPRRGGPPPTPQNPLPPSTDDRW